MEYIKGKILGSGKRAAIIMSRTNDQVVGKLLEGAVGELERSAMNNQDITVIEVPGAWEIAGCLYKLLENPAFDMIICLGAVIRGDTPHFDFISSQVARTVAEAGIRAKVPVSFGVLTCDSFDQAIDRSGGKAGNKGEEAARAALEMSDIYRELR